MNFIGIFSNIGEYLLSALTFIVIFSVLIILHELGHFWAARRAGVKVLEFGFGLPPKILGKKTIKKILYTSNTGEKKTREEEMEWTINAIPFGGFVRMEGEEEKSSSPFSFGNRPLGWRIVVVCGGVIMNFLLGWFLLTLGYGFGMNPLMPTLEQREQYVEQGFLEKKENAFLISSLPKDKNQQLGLKIMDMPILIDGHKISSPEEFFLFYTSALTNGKEKIEIEVKRFEITTQQFENKIFSIPVQKDSQFTKSSPQVKISEVLESSPASVVNLKKGDIILKIEQGNITESDQLIDAIARYHEKGIKNIRLTIQREGEENLKIFIISLTEDGKMGILLENSITEAQKEKIILSKQTVYIPVKKVSYPWIEAPQKAFTESLRWLGTSVDMIKNVFSSLLEKFILPEGIGGPVAIADTTYKLIDHGDWTKILQFTAILSLSLAVVNIMPFPGLDGGRLFFLLGEGFIKFFTKILIIIGCKKNPLPTQLPEKLEITLHAIGYIFLLGLIGWITWNDILRIFW